MYHLQRQVFALGHKDNPLRSLQSLVFAVRNTKMCFHLVGVCNRIILVHIKLELVSLYNVAVEYQQSSTL